MQSVEMRLREKVEGKQDEIHRNANGVISDLRLCESALECRLSGDC